MRVKPALLGAAMFCGAIVSATAAARAQDASSAPRDQAALIQMKSDLRNLVTAQEAYYADHQAYASSIDLLRFRASENVQPVLTVTQNNAWAAETRSTLLPNVVCAIYINVAEKFRPKGKNASADAEGEPACDLVVEQKAP